MFVSDKITFTVRVDSSTGSEISSTSRLSMEDKIYLVQALLLGDGILAQLVSDVWQLERPESSY